MLDYYSVARAASKEVGNHPGLLWIRDHAKKSEKVLDVGCGEGSRLNTLLPHGKKGWGVDINKAAIEQAKKQYPHHKFDVTDPQKLPFKDNEFDLVYSAFTLEHTTNPHQFIRECIRVCRPAGYVVILCPNFGAPNRRSPVSTSAPLVKLVEGFLNDYRPVISLNWKQVDPKSLYENIDDDTTVEPYLHSLLPIMSRCGVKIQKWSSMWEIEPWSANPRKSLFKIAGQAGIFPFKYWGPQIFVVGKKV